MKREVLQSYLDGWLTDTCNRYLNLVDDMGVVDRKKRAKKSARAATVRRIQRSKPRVRTARTWDKTILTNAEKGKVPPIERGGT